MTTSNSIFGRPSFPPAVIAALAVALLSACSEPSGSMDKSASSQTPSSDALPTDTAMAFMHVVDARINAPVQGQAMSAGYFRLMNHGSQPVTLIGFISDSVAVQMHTTAVENGGTTMRPLASITIAPDDQIVFKPGGNHLMIRNLPEEGQQLTLQMNFASGAALNADFAVVPMEQWMNHAGH
jgi:hypothetical protein